MVGMRVHPWIVSFLLIFLAGVEARAQKVSVELDRTWDLTKFRTFTLEVNPWGDPGSEARVSDRVARALEAKGWVRTDPEVAELVVRVHASAIPLPSEEAVNGPEGASGDGSGEATDAGAAGVSGGGVGISGTGEMIQMGGADQRKATIGTLLVDIVDPRSAGLILRGFVADTLSLKTAKNQKKLDKALKTMFSDVPAVPPPKK